jgi:pyruvate,orthophosphate dikinase
MSKKYVYLFQEGDANMRELLGGKGANLAEMTNLGLPVPKGFTVSTEACTKYYEDGKTINAEIVEQVEKALKVLEGEVGKKLGDPDDPLLVSVRSGARASMPGMMDTILNLGLNAKSVEGLARKTNNPRFAYDSYRRFIQMFSDVVMEISKSNFEAIFDKKKEEVNVKQDFELSADDLKDVVKNYKIKYKELKGEEFPDDPKVQLFEAIKAVFRSWDNPRANVYRKMNEIPYSWGTAVNVQQMVFGNKGETSGTGVAFTRNPATGEKALFGEYLFNAQGEDVVAGIRTPKPISELAKDNPAVYAEFQKVADTLEGHYRDMQDMEFTIEEGKLYMLQTRNGKRTASAALRVAIDLVKEGLLTKEEAIMKVEPNQLNALLHPQFDAAQLKKAEVITQALAASPGAATGKVVFTAQRAKELVESGVKKVILVRAETSPEDIEGMVVSQGILTERGGMTSHAAVVARGMGACCVAGASACHVNEEGKYFTCNGEKFSEGDWISLDGSTGKVYRGEIATVPASISGDFATFMAWADEIRKLEVRTNADTPQDAKRAFEFGAQGVGLVRTEHMFFNGA